MIRCLGPALELLHSPLARGLRFYGHRFKSLPLEGPQAADQIEQIDPPCLPIADSLQLVLILRRDAGHRRTEDSDGRSRAV